MIQNETYRFRLGAAIHLSHLCSCGDVQTACFLLPTDSNPCHATHDEKKEEDKPKVQIDPEVAHAEVDAFAEKAE